MPNVLFKGTPVRVAGELPSLHAAAPDFTLTDGSLAEQSLNDFRGKTILLNIFPSLDTPTCAASVRAFNRAAATLENTVVLCISADLPFAQNRYCGVEGITNAKTLSVFRHPEFGTTYGVRIEEGPLAQLLSRAVVVIDPQGKVVYTERVKEITDEPDYPRALAACADIGKR